MTKVEKKSQTKHEKSTTTSEIHVSLLKTSLYPYITCGDCLITAQVASCSDTDKMNNPRFIHLYYTLSYSIRHNLSASPEHSLHVEEPSFQDRREGLIEGMYVLWVNPGLCTNDLQASNCSSTLLTKISPMCGPWHAERSAASNTAPNSRHFVLVHENK